MSPRLTSWQAGRVTTSPPPAAHADGHGSASDAPTPTEVPPGGARPTEANGDTSEAYPDPGTVAALQVARELAAAGLPIFVGKNAGNPSHGVAGFWLPKGWQTTLADPAIVNTWRPGDALCMVTGRRAVGLGFDGIDIDPRNGGTGPHTALETSGTLPEVYGRATTPSGGEHLLVAPVGVRSRDSAYAGIDYKAGTEEGGRGFLFIAPTVKVSKETGEPAGYRWVETPDLARLAANITTDNSGRAIAEHINGTRQKGRAAGSNRAPSRSTEVPRGTQPAERRANPTTDTPADYVGATVAGVLRDLDELANLPDGQRNGHGHGWDSGTFAAACQLIRAANSGAGYPLDDAKEDYMGHAPTGGEFDPSRLEHKWDDALRTVGDEPLTPEGQPTGQDEAKQEKPDATRLVIEYAKEHYTFHRTSDGKVFAVPVRGTRRPVFINDSGRSPLKAAILARLYKEWDGRPPSGTVIERALGILHAEATSNGDTQPLDLRVARRRDTLVIDLGQPGNGRCVVVTGDGWTVEDNPPGGVLFQLPLKPLPDPRVGGSLGPLRELLGWDEHDRRWQLTRGWLVAACLPDIARPLLFFEGQPGSAKTTRARLVLSVLDPRDELGSSFGRNEDDERVSALRRYLVGWDNISRASDAVSDALCRLVTGDESSKRTLYADADLTVISFRRTGAITAVSMPSLRADALERLIQVGCDPINSAERLSESKIVGRFKEAHPTMLGALLDELVVMLRNLEASRDRADDRARMADFHDALHALDPRVASAYGESVEDVMADAAASDPFTSVVVEWLSGQRLPVHMPTVTAARLAAAVHRPATEPRDYQPWWPSTDKAFSDALTRAAGPLRAMGYRVERPTRTRHGRPVVFLAVGPEQGVLSLGGEL